MKTNEKFVNEVFALGLKYKMTYADFYIHLKSCTDSAKKLCLEQLNKS